MVDFTPEEAGKPQNYTTIHPIKCSRQIVTRDETPYVLSLWLVGMVRTVVGPGKLAC